MKKIVLLCFAAAVAVAAQAASVNWTITNVYVSDEAKLAKGTGSAYLFLTENTTDMKGLTTTSLADVQALLKGGKFSDVVNLSVSHGANSADGTFGGATGLSGFSSGSLSAFAIVFDGKSAEEASNYFIVSGGDLRSAEFVSPTGMKTLAWGDQTKFTQGAGAWTPTKGSGDVPEPTSGVLLLLGMAGLALRRKQK